MRMAKFFAALKRRHIYGVSAAAIVIGVSLYQVLAPAPTVNAADQPAPSLTESEKGFDAVFGARWEAISFATQQGEEDARGWGTLEFARARGPGPGGVLVRGDCNSSFGPYALGANNGIEVELNQTTLVACPPARDRLKMLVLNATRYSLKDGDLFLEVRPSLRGGGTLRFRRCSDAQLRDNLRKGECSWGVRPALGPPEFSRDAFKRRGR